MSPRLCLLRTVTLARAFSTASSTISAHSSSPALLPKSSSSPVLSGYGHLCGFNRPSPPSRCMIVRCRVSNSGSVYSPLDSNDSGRRESLFPGCDYEHWLVTMEFPDPQTTREQKIDTFVKTLANVVGSEEEAKKRIYALSTTTYTGFMCEISEELSEKIKKEPGVEWVLPDSYGDPIKKEYGVGDNYINGVIITDTRVFNRPTGRDRPRNRRRDSMPIERRDVQTSRDPLPTLGGRDNIQGNSVPGDQRDFRPTESRDSMQGGQSVYRPMDGRATVAGDRQDYRPLPGDRQDYRPPVDARGPMPGYRQDYRPPVDARGPMPGYQQDYRPPVDARGPFPGNQQDYRSPVDARGPFPGNQQDYRPPVDARGPMPEYRQDYRPPLDGRDSMSANQQDYRPPVDARGPMPEYRQDYRPPLDGRDSMSAVRQDYRSPVDARGPMPVSGDQQDYRPPVDPRGATQGGQLDYRPPTEGKGWMPGHRQDYMPPMEGGGSVSGESRGYMPSREPTQGQQRDSIGVQSQDPVHVV